MVKEICCSVNDAEIHVEGIFLYKTDYGANAAKSFLNDFLAGNTSFDDLYGAYLANIVYPDGRTVFFSDNSGMRRYFINHKESRFEKTFSAALPLGEKLPDYNAIAQFLYFGCIYNCDTIEKNVCLSKPEAYYIVSKDKIEEKPKGLTPMEQLEHDEDILAKVMSNVSRAVKDYENCFCTVTGGVDSRSILAHLLHNKVKPVLNITGQLSDVDVVIAKEVASKTAKDLLVVEDTPEDGWVDEAIKAASLGMSGVCGTYRLYKKAKKLASYGTAVEFGGLAGEMYKNSFINQDFPFYDGKPDWDKFLKFKVMYYKFPEAICGESIKHEISNMKKELYPILSRHTKDNKAKSYLAAGYMILQQRSAGFSAMNGHHYTAYNPLLERKVAAYAFNKSPHDLEMQAFQRQQVSEYFPAIKNIKTDRGLTCDSGKKGREWLKSMCFMFNVWRKRMVGRKVSGRLDICTEQGLNSPQYEKAFNRCMDLGILSKGIKNTDVPAVIADRIFLIGSVL